MVGFLAVAVASLVLVLAPLATPPGGLKVVVHLLVAGLVYLDALMGVLGVHPLASSVRTAALYPLQRLLYFGQRLFVPAAICQ